MKYIDLVSEDPPTIRLKFRPGGPGHKGDDYYLSPKENKYVINNNNIIII